MPATLLEPSSRRARRTLAVLLVATTLVAGACGGSAATPAPTAVPTVAPAATPAPATPGATLEVTPQVTAAPTEPSETPAEPAITTPPSGTFLFGYEDLLTYYQATGYECQDPGPSAVAAGYTTHICTYQNDRGSTDLIGFLVDEGGTLGDAFAGVLNPAGGEMPDTADMIAPLAFILGATLGETEGAAAAGWLVENLGTDMAQAEFNGITVYTYTVNDASGIGAYSEVATPEYLAAPAP